MSVRFGVEEFFESSGNAAAEFTEALRDGVATFACGLWASFPGFITDGVNPANAFARGFMNRACSPIQPPVTAPAPPFEGGQCATQYDIEVSFDYFPAGSSTIAQFNDTIFTNILGPITEITDNAVPNNNTFQVTVFFPSSPSGSVTVVNAGSGANILIETIVYTVTRVDGQPDNCGDLPASYDSPPPTSNDLNEITNITINDGLDLQLEIQYIKGSDQYNFPMFFKVNGVNVSLDVGGITIYAPDDFGSPSGGNNLPPPGSDPGEDGAGGGVTKIFDENEYIVAPPSPVPRSVKQLIEYVLCTDGVIETITQTIQIGVGSNTMLLIVIEMVKQILQDLCEMPEAILGLPEYYGLQPGANRPAIVYLWKEYINETWQSSTYSSTVHHPTGAAIVDIENLTSIEKTIGTYKTFVRLTDGSVIQATGDTPANSSANFTFLITQVSSSFLPPDLIAATVTSIDSRLNVKTLNLRQIEYYPNGKMGNASPSIRRVVEP